MVPALVDTCLSTPETFPFPTAPPTKKPTRVLDIDKKTKDHHVPRDERMIRLTGNHPFNSEAPLSELFDAGFLTPPELFYVRNHGPVPMYTDKDCEDWVISIEGLVDKPMQISLRQLMQDYEQITLPVTLVCAGNRRKEQNIVRKGSGFNWGAAGVSTSLWTGPLLRDIIAKAKPHRKAKYVCFAGDDDLPNGNYETCVKMSWAKSFERGIMLAYKQNGEALRPDHGRPLRVVIPGAIGGRSVKWLTKIIITEQPSQNWYHIYDNRVLPTVVDPEMAKSDKSWWQDERYAINDLNVQSAICKPAHDEVTKIKEGTSYTVRGYAYSGAGARVGRVELSLDRGKTWRLASIEYPEDTYRDYEGFLYGGRIDMSERDASWCWCFYSLDIPTSDLASASDIVVRAMDENMNLQPRDMYWNVMSMLNNCWFRIAIHQEGENLRFEHPTQAAMIPGGWMQRVVDAGGDLQSYGWGEIIDNTVSADTKQSIKEKKKIVMTKEGLKNLITLQEVEKHRTEEDCWFINNGEVYDATSFLKEHPGGPDSITMVGGEDATEDFMAIHSETAKQMLIDYHIGTLANSEATPPGTPELQHEADSAPYFLTKKWASCSLYEKFTLSKDSRMLRFKLQHPEQELGLPCGQHLYLKTKTEDGDAVMRAYTPVSKQSAKGFLDVLIKVYFSSQEYPSGGKMTMALESLQIGDTIQVKGPIGHFEYLGRGSIRQAGQERHVEKFWMVSGGSGITPIYQVMRAIAADEDDETQCLLLDSNRYEEDILCRPDLETYSTKSTITTWHTLSAKSGVRDNWDGGRGRLTYDVFDSKFVREEGVSTMVLVCGPPALEKSVKAWAHERGIPADDVLVF